MVFFVPSYSKKRIWFVDEFSNHLNFPFPIYYDLNLSGEFTVNLTADRLRIIPDEKLEKIMKSIYESTTMFFFEKLGIDEVRKNKDFFYKFTDKRHHQGEIFKTLLDNFLCK
jgi:hypothetical protein